MKKLFKKTLIASALVSGLGLTQIANAAPTQFSGNGHWYEFINTGYDIGWNNAASLASSSTHMGAVGHLATVSDAAENAFITSLGVNGYLGGSDAASEGTWQWITGETWNFTAWAPGEPNNSGYIWWLGGVNENYLVNFGSGLWNDIHGNYEDGWVHGYFVEYEPGSVAQTPIPAAVWLFGTGIAGLFSARKKKQIA